MGTPIAIGTQVDGGFESRLISLTIEAQLKGRFQRDVQKDGIRITLQIPIH